jgi:adenosine deaminase
MSLLGPLPDLHRHLDGSLRRSTVEELAAQFGYAIPKKLIFFTGMGLEQALAQFEFTLALLKYPQQVERVAREICEDAQQEQVSSLEIRFAPQLHTGAPPEEIVDAALSGIANQAGLILCGLYGESPEILKHLVEIAISRPGVVGIDLAGGPQPSATYHLRDYRTAFHQARKAGLGTTVHAGEGRPAQEIMDAVVELQAQRIGHGTTLLQLSQTIDIIIENEVTIEACLTSNLQTGAIASLEAHPLKQWLTQGVRVCICTDNTLFSDVTSESEHQLAQARLGLNDEQMQMVIQAGHQAKFARN